MFANFLNGLLGPSPAQLPPLKEQLALSALLVRLARADDDYSLAEATRIDRVLVARYGLTPKAATELRSKAEVLESEAPDTVRFTRALKAAVPEAERAALVEALWNVALADGGRAAEEDQLLRLVANLLGLTDLQSGLARQRAERGLG